MFSSVYFSEYVTGLTRPDFSRLNEGKNEQLDLITKPCELPQKLLPDNGDPLRFHFLCESQEQFIAK